MRMTDQRRAIRPWSSTQPADVGEVTEERLELLEVTYSGLNAQLYRSLRNAGICHSDVMEAHALGADLEVYCFLREEYGHNEAVIEAGATGTMQHQDAVRLGVSAEDLNDLRACYRSEVTEFWRTMAMSSCQSRVRPSPPMTAEYLAARRAGLAHLSSLEFARRLAEFTTRNGGVRMTPRDVEAWARCRFAGLQPEFVAAASPALNSDQLAVLHSVLFLLVSYDGLDEFDQAELLWLAARSPQRTVDPHAYVAARRSGCSRRRALRRSAI
jgi:hypothetical protein